METHRETYNSVIWHVRPATWRPPVDVFDTAENFVIRIEIAGMRDEDLEVTVQDNYLLISGSRTDTSEKKAYHQMEIPFGKFSVGVDMPSRVMIEDATVEYQDGFLTIRLPKEI
jgi:HSP20 family molecular chaperone IbpA